MAESNFAAGLEAHETLHFDQLDAELQDQFFNDFDAHFSAEQSGENAHLVRAANLSDVLAKTKIALATAATVYATLGQFVPANYDKMIKIALATATAAINAVPTT